MSAFTDHRRPSRQSRWATVTSLSARRRAAALEPKPMVYSKFVSLAGLPEPRRLQAAAQ